MLNSLKNFFKKTFVRNVIILVTGTAGAQIIAMLASPIVTRLYGPEAFGVMGTFSALISTIGPAAALTYPIAIVLPKRNKDAIGLMKLSIYITVIISIISLIILFLFNRQITDVFNLEEISTYLYLIPFVILFAGLMQVTEQWLIRTKQFTINARVTVIQSFITNSSKIGIGLFYPFASVLVLLSVLANGINAVLMGLFIRKSNRNILSDLKDVSREKMLKLAKKHNDFPIYRAPEVFLFSVSSSIPVLMLAALFGPASAGFYSIGRTVLRVPSGLIGQAVGNVFYPRIAEASNKGENLTQLIKRATLALGVVGIIPYGLVVLFGPFLFSLVFGADWTVAGEYARWIALGSFFMFMNHPSVRSLPVLKAQRFHLVYTIITLVIRASALAIGFYIFESDYVAVALFGLSDAIINIFLILITLRISRREVIK